MHDKAIAKSMRESLNNLLKVRASCNRHNLPKPPHLEKMIARAREHIARLVG